MNRYLERKKDFIGGITFIIFVAVLIVGGFFLTRYLTSEKEHKKVVQSEIDKLKIDSKKDLVYYENEIILSPDPDIIHKDIIINLKEADTVNELLKKSMDNIRNSVKKKGEVEIDSSKELLYDIDIISTKERNYTVYESLKYLSVLVTDSDFTCYNGSTITSQTAYTFSLSTGKRLSNDTLIGYAGLSIDDIKNKVRNKLEEDQKDLHDGETINIDETINLINIKDLVIYTNKTGKIVISFVVKTNDDSYNDTIELN
ncbi:MAG: hypothetical protein IKX00_02280 [Bacilli bacterium]|nr:hypothetical protein [Bacilli bacterium]